MSSTTVAQHTTQPLNFGPEWLRALSTPDTTTTTTPIPSSSASSSGNVFRFSATKYRYSKEQILALRANVTERLAEDIRNEIRENLKDVESVFRPNIIEPLSLTAPTSEEAARLSAPSSYISGRTPGGGGRGGHNSQPSQQQSHELRANRGGNSMSNGRGGSRGRGGRENAFGPNRGNADDHGETGGGNDEPSSNSSWSRGAGFHSRGGSGGNGGGSIGTRVRSYDDREQPQTSRRGGGSTRQTSDAWRRSKGDDDENNDQNEEPGPSKNSSWITRSGQPRRGASNSTSGGGYLEHRTKSSDKWSHTDERPGQSNSYESNHPRGSEGGGGGGGWRTNSMSDRDNYSRRPPTKRDKMPEWMDDGNENDVQLGHATFEQGGTFITAPSTKPSNNSSNSETHKQSNQSVAEDSSIKTANPVPSKPPPEESKVEQSSLPRIDNSIVNIPAPAKANVNRISPVQQPPTTWEDECEPSDVATTVVEATLADDHDYSPPPSVHPTPHPFSIEPTSTTASLNSQNQRIQSAPVSAPVVPTPIIDDKQWFYRDPQNIVQGPFSSADMERWFTAGYFTILLPVKRYGETQFTTIQQLIKELGRLPFRSDTSPVPMPTTGVIQQPMVTETSKFNANAYPTSSGKNNNYLEDSFVQSQVQQQQRSAVQQSALFNRQTSMPGSSSDRKVVSTSSGSMISPQIQSFFTSQSQQPSLGLFPTNLPNDPAAHCQQPISQLQRSISATNQQPLQTGLYDDVQRSFRSNPPAAPGSATFFSQNIQLSQTHQQPQQPNDIMARLAQAMQNHGQQQQEKVEEQRRLEQQRHEMELERLKSVKMEQSRLQREEEERRRLEQLKQQQQQHMTMNEELKKPQTIVPTQMMLNQMREMAKMIEQKNAQQTVQNHQMKPDIDPLLAFQKSLQFQKEQQAKIEAQKEENIRRYQQYLREQSQSNSSIQAQSNFKLPDTANWARHASQSGDHAIQPLNFVEIQKQEQEQERRAREAALVQQMAKSEAVNMNNSSSNAKGATWARTLFSGSGTNPNAIPVVSSHSSSSSDRDQHDTNVPESPNSVFNQQATNAPKPRSTAQQQAAPWSGVNKASPSTSLYDIQLQQQQQLQKEVKQQQQQQQQHPINSNTPNASTPAWGTAVSQSNTHMPAASLNWGDHSTPPPSSSKASGNKPSTSWKEAKPAAASGSSTKSNASNNAELSKSEREAKHLFNVARTEDALTKWTQTQYKDNLQAIDVPTLVQLLKDIDNPDEIFEYVQPYLGSVTKAREFSQDFISKKRQIASAEPELDNERLNALAMAPTSSNASSSNADEGFQLASSNGQKKKAKKMKGQKIDVKQLGFMMNNRPEQRGDIDRVPM